MSVLVNRGDGTFADEVRYRTSRGPGKMAVGDLDGDLDLDVATANLQSRSISVFENTCDVCPADLDGNGSVGFSDVLAILAAWGNSNGVEDLDFDGTVGTGDLLIVLAEWGPCP